MPDDDSMLSQGTVDERNEARKPMYDMPVRIVHLAATYPAPCPACKGTGGGVWNDCPTCGGNGVV